MTLTNTDLLDIYETMLTIRASESRMVALFKEHEFGGHVLPCLGQEAIRLRSARCWRRPTTPSPAIAAAGTTSPMAATWTACWPNTTARRPV